MKIDGSRPIEGKEQQIKIRDAKKRQEADNSEDTRKAGNSSDKISLSGKAKEISELKKLINELPEIRADKVEALKKAIDSGTYSVDSLKLAGKILEEES